MSQQILELVEKSSLKAEVPEFNIGDTVDVHTKILEGDKERIQIFSGVVIARSGSGSREMFTVRRIVPTKASSGSSRSIRRGSPRSKSSAAASSDGPSSTTSATAPANRPVSRNAAVTKSAAEMISETVVVAGRS